jgi:hypothetical protein
MEGMKTNIFLEIFFVLFFLALVFGFSAYNDYVQTSDPSQQENSKNREKGEEIEEIEKDATEEKREDEAIEETTAKIASASPENKNIEDNTNLEFAPFKNELFEYLFLHEEKFSGDFLTVDYSMQRDLMERDAIPEDKAKDEYINLLPEFEQELSLNGKKYLQMQSTNIDASKKTPLVIYIHGGGGDRFQGFNDGSFGGNFNRIKNLMFVNNGIYITPDIYDFNQGGTNTVLDIIKKKKSEFSNLEVYIACGSSGGNICWSLANKKGSESWLRGILLLGSMTNEKYLQENLWKNIPVYIGHGTRDPIMSYTAPIDFFTRLKQKKTDYPIKIHIFATGTHGTPIRMTDWHMIISWMQSLQDQ